MHMSHPGARACVCHLKHAHAPHVLLLFVCAVSGVVKVFLEVMNSVLMTGEIPGLYAKDEMMAMTADLRSSFLKVKRVLAPSRMRQTIGHASKTHFGRKYKQPLYMNV